MSSQTQEEKERFEKRIKKIGNNKEKLQEKIKEDIDQGVIKEDIDQGVQNTL